MAQVILEIDVSSAIRTIEKIQGALTPEQLLNVIYQLFKGLSTRAANHIIRNTLSGQILKRRSGELAKSITGRAEIVAGVPAMRVGIFSGPALDYAGVLEFGTKDRNRDSPYPIIRPVNAKALAYPNPKDPRVVGPTGIPKLEGPREYTAMYGRDLKFVPFRRGIAVGALFDEVDLKLEREQARKAKREINLQNIKAVYLLLSQLSMDARQFLLKGMQSFVPIVVQELQKVLTEYLNAIEGSAKKIPPPSEND